MRCRACNAELTDNESINKDANGYLDTCLVCLGLGSDTTPMEKEYVSEASTGFGNNDDT